MQNHTVDKLQIQNEICCKKSRAMKGEVCQLHIKATAQSQLRRHYCLFRCVVNYYGFTGYSCREIQKGVLDQDHVLDWHTKCFLNYLLKFAAHA
jgi:hypothetical protein